jgi:hypothetical protein
LTELARMLESPPETDTSGEPRLARLLYPAGCKSQHEATEQFLSAFTTEMKLELDNKIQEVIRRDYTALIHVCMTSKNMLKDVQQAMIQTAIEFTSSMLSETSVSEILLDHFPDPAKIGDEMASFYTEAAPELAERSSETTELFILATPPGSASDAVTASALRALPNAEPNLAASHDDIILYRETANLPLVDLDQMGTAAQEAYRQLAATEHFTPHIRSDIEFEPVANDKVTR